VTEIKPNTYIFAPDHLAVVVAFEGTVYSFSKTGAPLASLISPRDRAVIRALLSAAIDDLDAQVKS
jgi:hypothetical protein